MAKSLINQALREIAGEYQPGTLPWMKTNRPNEWNKLVTLEHRINEMALGGNQDGISLALDDYRKLILAMVREGV